MVGGVVVATVRSTYYNWEPLLQVVGNQVPQKPPIMPVAAGGDQTGDHLRLRIQAAMGLVTVKILLALMSPALLIRHIVRALAPPACIRITWHVTVVLALLIFRYIHVGDAMRAIDQL